VLFDYNPPPGRSDIGCATKTGSSARQNMTDLVYIGIVVGFFIVGGLYAELCERM
jgi:hypothetical protein